MTIDTLIAAAVSLVTNEDLFPFIGFIIVASVSGGLFRYLSRAAK